MPCALCERIRSGPVLLENAHALAVPDGFPLSPGHSLILSRRHESDLFALSGEERDAIFALLPPLKDLIQREHSPSGFNVGVNVGTDAGQTVPHVHLHLIPRSAGDVPDPRGGVRWVLPAKARYWP